MKKLTIFSLVLASGIGASIILNGCAASEKISSKIGAQLWGENCLRCHNTPDPADYSDQQWELIGTHMKLRVNSLTDVEINKIVEFMKTAN